MFPLKDNIPTRRFPVLTVALIVVNVIIFLAFQGFFSTSQAQQERKVVEYGAIPYEISHPGKECAETTADKIACEGQPGAPEERAPSQPSTILTLFTSMFMHGGILHIAGNMLFLWIFGNNVEDSMGRPRFLLFYLLGGLAALGAQTAVDPSSTAPTIGASGAIAAVLGGYALLYPRARVITVVFLFVFFTFLELPAFLVLGGWFALQALDAAVDQTGTGGVAYFAHIGGFLFGLLLIKLFADRAQRDYLGRQRLPVY
jgi:membrane associated rhomboid family serine protease